MVKFENVSTLTRVLPNQKFISRQEVSIDVLKI